LNRRKRKFPKKNGLFCRNQEGIAVSPSAARSLVWPLPPANRKENHGNNNRDRQIRGRAKICSAEHSAATKLSAALPHKNSDDKFQHGGGEKAKNHKTKDTNEPEADRTICPNHFAVTGAKPKTALLYLRETFPIRQKRAPFVYGGKPTYSQKAFCGLIEKSNQQYARGESNPQPTD
jgi:hypothetical protein